MTASTNTFQAVVPMTCQFGNPTDTRGFRRSVGVSVLAMQGGLSRPVYLVSDGEGKIGRASLVRPFMNEGVDEEDRIIAELYCTNARKIGPDWSLSRILESLDFSDADDAIISKHI